MKNCTKHFLERWTERIVGITTEKEMKDYINQNKDMIVEHANTTFEYAEFIYKGQIGDNVTRNYHIKDDLIFVTNTTDDAFITIYKVDLGFTKEINASVRKGLVQEIQKLTEEKYEADCAIIEEVEAKKQQVSLLDDQITVMEEQLKNMKKQRDFMKEEIKNTNSKSLNIGLEIRKFTLMLVNSKDYKNDLMSMK